MQSISSRWLCGLLLCGAATAMAQSVSGSVSAEESASSDSTVSASVISTDDGRITEPLSGGKYSSALIATSYPHNTIIGQKTNLPVDQQAGLALGVTSVSALRVLTSETHSNSADAKKMRLRAGRNTTTGPKESRLEADQDITTRPQKWWLEADRDFTSGSEEEQTEENQDRAGSSESLPDSTRGTGMVSPEDMGTASQLEWDPGLNFGFEDLSQQTFLSPTLDVREHFLKKRFAAERSKRLKAASILKKTSGSGIQSLLNETPHNGLSSESGLHSLITDPLDQP